MEAAVVFALGAAGAFYATQITLAKNLSETVSQIHPAMAPTSQLAFELYDPKAPKVTAGFENCADEDMLDHLRHQRNIVGAMHPIFDPNKAGEISAMPPPQEGLDYRVSEAQANKKLSFFDPFADNRRLKMH